MGAEKIIIPGCLIISGLTVCHQSPQQRIEWPTNPEDIKSFAYSHCEDRLRIIYPDTTIPQKTYEDCVMQSINTLSSPFYRFLDENSQDLMGSMIIVGGIILAVLPRIIRGRARFGLG